MSLIHSLKGVSVVVPAAGSGARMRLPIKKQFAQIDGQSILYHTISRLLSMQPDSITVVLPEGEEADLPDGPVSIVSGGETRRDSVLNGLGSLQGLEAKSWVMVHDGVRPCVNALDVFRLYELLESHPCGGLLGVPIVDTVKEVMLKDDLRVVTATRDRLRFWAAQTPQMFRFGLLIEALGNHSAVTDEAAAMEAEGHEVLMVEGSRDNIKVTRPEDLALAGFYLGEGASK